MRKGACIMTKTFIIDSGQKPTEEQLKEIEDAKNNPIVFDEDCEELSPSSETTGRLRAFSCVST